MLRHGVYAKETHETNLRIAPPIVIDRDGMDRIVRALEESLSEMAGRPKAEERAPVPAE